MAKITVEITKAQQKRILVRIAQDMHLLSDEMGISEMQVVSGLVWSLGVLAHESGLEAAGIGTIFDAGFATAEAAAQGN